jgi:microcystin-dependent protein
MGGVPFVFRRGSFANAAENLPKYVSMPLWDSTNHCLWFGRGDGTGGSLSSGYYYPRIDTNNNISLQPGTCLTSSDNTKFVGLYGDTNNLSFKNSSSNILSINNAGTVGVGTNSPRCSLDVNAKDAVMLPSGATGDRPATPVNGMIRYNTSLSIMEAYINGSWSPVGGIPIGGILSMSYGTVPTGFLEANGAAVSMSAYANLYAAIGTMYGPGDGSTTFNLPDYRGYFLRGWDDGRGIDSGRTLGSTQADIYGAHNHSYTDPGHAHISWASQSTFPDGDRSRRALNIRGDTWTSTSVTGITINSSGGTETRPKNMSVMFCIKW